MGAGWCPSPSDSVLSISIRAPDRCPNRKYANIANEIRGQIESGRLAPGARLLPAKELGDHMGCHQHTVRHALKMLMCEGFLKCVSGTYVTDMPSRLNEMTTLNR
ncbi:winged helix-turn-helix domain-containing protein [Pontiella sulfatireligans]|uniref:winged helix-turn-helix domain-containing protein n=1 Tax=Pontiella sulfatireligans TaxID=2750658 RepID=UPI00109D75ED